MGVPSLPVPSPPLHFPSPLAPLPFLPFPSLPISPPLPLDVGPLIQPGGLGSDVSSASGVWYGASAENNFGAF